MLGSLAPLVRLVVLMPILVDGRAVVSETIIEAAGGASVVVLTTTCPDLVVQLRTVYVGLRGQRHAVAIDLLTTHGEATLTERRLNDVPVTHARQLCLVDHAAATRDAVAGVTQGAVRVLVTDDATAIAAGAFSPSP